MHTRTVLFGIAAFCLTLGITPPAAPAALLQEAIPKGNAQQAQRAARSAVPDTAWAQTQLAQLTLEEKVAQLFTPWVTGHFQSADDASYQQLVRLVEDVGVGGLIFGRGDPLAQAVLVNDLQGRAKVPLLVAQDMEWGAGMRVERATSFPRAMALGATRDPDLAWAVGWATAEEARAIGTGQVYAPTADVNNNPDNPIINVRSFGERPALVAEMAAAFVRGVQSGGALATAKHFPGHGDTATDSHLDLPVLPFSRARLDTLELVPFRAALAAGVKSVMTGHLALPALEPDSTVPATLSPRVTQALLRGDLGFDGLVVTDALDMSGVTGHFGVGEVAVRALEAGADVLLMSTDIPAAQAAVLRAVKDGRLSEARIDASVQRVLESKQWLGLHERRRVDVQAVAEHVGTRLHAVLRDHAARQSLTLLRNEDDLLPLTPPARPRVLSITLSDSGDPDAGAAFSSQLRRTAQADALTLRRLPTDASPAEIDALVQEAAGYDVVLVPAFIRVRAWSGRLSLSEAQQQLLGALVRSETPVALVAFGNPYMARALPAQPAAYLTAYGADAAAQRAAAEALFGQSGTPGRLPVTIPDHYAYGDGLTLEQTAPRVDVPEAASMDSRDLARVDSLLEAAVAERAFPGAAVAVGYGDVVTKLSGTGYHTYEMETPVTPQARFDLASLTKVVATTTAAMQLYEDGRLDLDAAVSSYLPDFAQNGKQDVTIRQLLTHSAGLAPYRRFDQMGLTTRAEAIDAIMAEELQYAPGTDAQYSGLGIITLSLVIEKLTGQPLDAYAEQHIFEPLGMTRTGFRPAGQPDSSVVPTADAERTYYGEVHDPVARFMGGTSANAGLFSTAEDLSKFAYMLTHGGRIYGRQFLKEETIDLFTTRAAGPDGSTRALGWDTKSQDGYSSAGRLFGPRSFGHTGFTGTSLWIDPDQQLFALLLASRVYPSGGTETSSAKMRAVRPAFADLVVEAIVASPAPLLPEKLQLQQAAR